MQGFIKFRFAAAICAIAAVVPIDFVAAQRTRAVPQAFAAVQAPESAVEICHGTSAQAAFDCARRRCERKAGRGACFSVTVCGPSGWAGVMGVQIGETHFSTTVCGAPTQEAMLAALRAFCGGQASFKQCSIAQVWSPDGKQHAVEQSWTPADFGK